MSQNPTGPPYSDEQMAAYQAQLGEPHPDNVDALAEAVSRFHAKATETLPMELAADVTRQFAIRMLDRATVVVHYLVDGE